MFGALSGSKETLLFMSGSGGIGIWTEINTQSKWGWSQRTQYSGWRTLNSGTHYQPALWAWPGQQQGNAVYQQGSELSSEGFHLHSLIFLLKLQITELMIMGWEWPYFQLSSENQKLILDKPKALWIPNELPWTPTRYSIILFLWVAVGSAFSHNCTCS